MDYYRLYRKYKAKYLRLRNDTGAETDLKRSSNKLVAPKRSFIRRTYQTENEEDLEKLKFTEESIYSVSQFRGTQFLLRTIRRYVDETADLVLTDGTANVGSDSLNLADHFHRINAVEICAVNHEALVNNAKVLKKHNVVVYHQDINEFIDELKQDIIYIDAPWGGKDYKEKERLDLYLGDISISEFFQKHQKKARFHVYKVPTNYDIELMRKVGRTRVHRYFKGDRISYLILVVFPFRRDDDSSSQDKVDLTTSESKDT